MLWSLLAIGLPLSSSEGLSGDFEANQVVLNDTNEIGEHLG